MYQWNKQSIKPLVLFSNIRKQKITKIITQYHKTFSKYKKKLPCPCVTENKCLLPTLIKNPQREVTRISFFSVTPYQILDLRLLIIRCSECKTCKSWSRFRDFTDVSSVKGDLKLNVMSSSTFWEKLSSAESLMSVDPVLGSEVTRGDNCSRTVLVYTRM